MRPRIKAAERDTSLTALVREFLTKLGEDESDFERRKWLQDEVLASVRRFSAGDRVARSDAHGRSALR